MNDLTKQDALELEVANFGPIVEAKIDLRPLTVFVGPSNTGKSYLATLIYALHMHFNGRSPSSRFFLNYEALMGARGRIVDRETIDAIRTFLEQVSTAAGEPLGERTLILLAPIVDAIRLVFEVEADQLHNEIGRCFGIDKTSTLIRRGHRKCARIVLRKHFSNDSATFEHELTLKRQGVKFGTTMSSEKPVSITVRDREESIEYYDRMMDMLSKADRMGQDWNRPALGLIDHLLGLSLPQLVGSLYRAAFYLPADRTGVMHSHQVVVSALVQHATTAGLRPDADIPMLSGVIADFLQQLILVHPSTNRQPNRGDDLGTQIEETILGGRVRVDRSEMIGYPHFTYQPEGWKNPLPLMNASSMVSELAPVVLYLRHLVAPGSVLIIEEPESHLHPAMQVEFTRQIAALVHAGVRVIVTTHSEWVLEELANIVQRSKLSKARRKEIPQGDFALRPDQVGAWLFKQKLRPKGSVVEEVELDAETGLYPTDYDAVSAALYNESVSIFNRIEDSDAE